MLLIEIAFIAGIVSILSPCIWSILPIIIATAVNSNPLKNLSLILGIVVSYIISTLLLSFFIKLLNIDTGFFRLLATSLLIFSGLTMMIPRIADIVESKISFVTRHIHTSPTTNTSHFLARFMTGMALGILWTPCVGPIMTVISTLAATQVLTTHTISIAIAYSLGVGLSLFTVTLIENVFLAHHSFVANHTRRLQQFLGFIIIVAALFMYTNYDRLVNAQILSSLPTSVPTYSQIENMPLAQKELEKLRQGRQQVTPTITTNYPTPSIITPVYQSNLPYLGEAPKIAGVTHWFNTTETLSLEQFRGKVILLDFWAYTCTACLPSIPQKNRWIKEYQNFVIIALHVPSTAEGKSVENVQNALKQYGVQYPVGMDSDFISFDRYKTNLLPSEYLIDYNGVIRYKTTDGNAWNETEAAIQELLREIGSL